MHQIQGFLYIHAGSKGTYFDVSQWTVLSDHIHVTGDIHITLTESVENEKNQNGTRQF